MKHIWQITCASMLVAACLAATSEAQRIDDGNAPSNRDALRARSIQTDDGPNGQQQNQTYRDDVIDTQRQRQAIQGDAQSQSQQSVQANRTDGQTQSRNSGAADNRWRYKRHNGEWWYWTNNNNWLYWRNGRWNPYYADNFQPRVTRQFADQTGRSYNPSNDGRYYDDGRTIRRYSGDGYINRRTYDGNYYDGRFYDNRFDSRYNDGGRYWTGYRGDPRYNQGYNQGWNRGYGGGYGNPYVNPRQYFGNQGYQRGADVGSAIGGALGGQGGAGLGGAIGGAIGADQ
jgi:hypothetical protein